MKTVLVVWGAACFLTIAAMTVPVARWLRRARHRGWGVRREGE